MRSLFIEYKRIDKGAEIFAHLFSAQLIDMKIDLPVVTTDSTGIEIKLPDSLTGIFYLRIQDGEQSLFERIAIQ